MDERFSGHLDEGRVLRLLKPKSLAQTKIEVGESHFSSGWNADGHWTVVLAGKEPRIELRPIRGQPRAAILSLRYSHNADKADTSRRESVRNQFFTFTRKPVWKQVQGVIAHRSTFLAVAKLMNLIDGP